MNVYKSIEALPQFKQTVLTIGSFDGLHLGHQRILQRVCQKARENRLESVVVTFCPHPRLVLSPGDLDFKLLSVDEEKIRLFSGMGIDHLVLYPFSFEFSQQSPYEYIENFLVRRFNPAYIIIGYDHRFGKNRSGDIWFLKKLAPKYGYQIIEIPKQQIDEVGISSTLIRRAIEDGDIPAATAYSGHNYRLSGKVVYGYKYGRKLGFPTANLQVARDKLVPADGVYAVRVFLEGEPYGGLMYIGNKPSFDDHGSRVIEVNIFDFEHDIYGEMIEVELISLIRKDRKFASFDALKEQLQLDRLESMDILKELPIELKQEASIAVVILNFNGRELLEEYLPSVIQSSSYPIEYVVADNGSSDGSIRFLQEYYPEITVFELDQNFGFAEGYNRVINSLQNKEYIVFLNSDVETEDQWLDPLIDLMESDKRIAIAQPKILSYDDRTQFEYAGAAGGFLDLLAYPFCRGRLFDTLEVDEGQYDDIREVFWSSGAAMVMRKKVFDAFGGFDTDFFAHQEEIDLCWRVKKAGFKVMAVGESCVYHLGGGTLSYINPHKTYLNFRNNLMMLLKNDTLPHILVKFPVRLVLDGIAAIRFLIEGKSGSALAILQAHWSVYRKLGAIAAKRKQLNAITKKWQVGTERMAGKYYGIVIWDYFIRGKKKFSSLKTDV